jgi:NTP pyrophosphatase (non-canonical NTP hydrolase)
MVNSEDYLAKLFLCVEVLNKRFPDGNQPFKIITRLCEEAGELAQMVNHFEGSGIKRQKMGEPSREHLTKEVLDVLRAALSIARYYGIEQELYGQIDTHIARSQEQGFLE